MKKLIKFILIKLGLKDRIDGKVHHYVVNKTIKNKNVEDRFSSIYENKIWLSNSNKESASGSGSTLEYTEKVRNWIPQILEKLETKILVDIGCGDFNWMKELKLPSIYIGTDIVKSVIDNNIKNYQTDKISFIHSNAIEEPIPEGDTIICRDVLFHLSFKDGLAVIENIKKSSAKYLITTSFEGVQINEDIYTGNFRRISLQSPPYDFPEPMYILFETEKIKDRFLGVWEIIR